VSPPAAYVTNSSFQSATKGSAMKKKTPPKPSTKRMRPKAAPGAKANPFASLVAAERKDNLASQPAPRGRTAGATLTPKATPTRRRKAHRTRT
jgi:hypothetical protein